MRTPDFKDLHVPRPDLAREYLDVFDRSDSRSLAIFGARGLGKTEFLQRELGPLAEKAGRVVVYADLWKDSASPADTLADALRRKTYELRGEDHDRFKLKGISVGGGFAKMNVGAKIEKSGYAVEPDRPISRLGHWMDHLADAAGKKKIFLMIDEVQSLATTEEGVSTAAALRGGMQTNFRRYEAVFTGSSRQHLAEMFQDMSAPLWRFGEEKTMPPLGREYTDAVAARIRAEPSAPQISADALSSAFTIVGYQPAEFMDVVKLAMQQPAFAESRTFLTLANTHAEAKRDRVFASLPPLQQAVLYTVGSGAQPTSQESLAYYAEALGSAAVSKSNVTYALEQLRERHVVFQSRRGKYEIENPVLREWVAEGMPHKLGYLRELPARRIAAPPATESRSQQPAAPSADEPKPRSPTRRR